MRLFLGIPLPAVAIEELSSATARLRVSSAGLRWSAPEAWHITLQFLGNTGPERYTCVVAELRELHLRAIPIAFESLGVFDHAGILFADVRVTHELIALQKRVIERTGLCGFVPESRPFHPHITLARSKGKAQNHGLHQLKNQIHRHPPHFTRFVADVLLLYESFTGPTGSRYEIRERFPLEGVSDH